jgi:hypothetical protein
MHTCHRANGVCGTVDQDTYPCPTYKLRSSISIHCDLTPGDQSGFCNLSESVPAAPDLPAGAAALNISEPQDGDVFADESRIEFRYSVSAAHFLIVMDVLPKTTDDIMTNAIWGAALPHEAKADRVVHWSDGVAIQDWKWQDQPGPAPPDKDLFAIVVGVNGGAIVSQSKQAPRFRVGVGWPSVGADCHANAADEECFNPKSVQSCVGTHCEKLCLKDTDCESSFCVLDAVPPYCSR